MSGVTVQEDLTGPPGHALIRVRGGARAQGSPGFRLHRQAEWGASVLGPAGWQVPEALLTPRRVSVEGNDLVLGVGPEVCRHLEGGTYQFTVPAADVDVTVFWPEIATPDAFEPPAREPPPKSTPIEDQTVILPAIKEPPVTPPQVKEPAKPEPKQGSEKKKAKLPAWVWVATLLALIAIAGGTLKLLQLYPFEPAQQDQTGQQDQPLHAVQPPQPTPPPADQLDSLSVRDLIARNKPDEMFAQAQRRLAAKPGDALLLLEAAGEDRHYGPALAMLARLNDPNLPRQGGIPESARQAARYYREAALAGETGVAADREALRALLLRRKQGGDFGAGLVLQDFWP